MSRTPACTNCRKSHLKCSICSGGPSPCEGCVKGGLKCSGPASPGSSKTVKQRNVWTAVSRISESDESSQHVASAESTENDEIGSKITPQRNTLQGCDGSPDASNSVERHHPIEMTSSAPFPAGFIQGTDEQGEQGVKSENIGSDGRLDPIPGQSLLVEAQEPSNRFPDSSLAPPLVEKEATDFLSPSTIFVLDNLPHSNGMVWCCAMIPESSLNRQLQEPRTTLLGPILKVVRVRWEEFGLWLKGKVQRS